MTGAPTCVVHGPAPKAEAAESAVAAWQVKRPGVLLTWQTLPDGRGYWRAASAVDGLVRAARDLALLAPSE